MQLVGDLAPAGRDQRPGFWRGALSGLTPQVVAIVAALLLIRMLATTGHQIIPAATNGYFAAWLRDLFEGNISLVLMAAPMLVVIMATANLRPRQGSKWIAALSFAVVLSAGVGALIRVIVFDPDWSFARDMASHVWPRFTLLGGMLTMTAELYRSEGASNDAA